ncbi:hypothetical protein ACHBIF_08710 [Streptococcus sp. A11]|uniref:hypothetical protein n=1 Tax=Streptococcus sp. A11 TaxID=3373124 RepID=UPI00374D0798
MRKWFSFSLLCVASLCLASCRMSVSYIPSSPEEQSVQAAEQEILHFELFHAAGGALANQWDRLASQPESKEVLLTGLLEEKRFYEPFRGQSFVDPTFNGLVEPHLEIVEEVSSSWRPMTSRIFRIAGLPIKKITKSSTAGSIARVVYFLRKVNSWTWISS